ncbi:hypothetical protein Mapa_011389 [Marchantia paleacea]|nr:hypothetical protein Mapa_011389 [Marchantia paleacea]
MCLCLFGTGTGGEDHRETTEVIVDDGHFGVRGEELPADELHRVQVGDFEHMLIALRDVGKFNCVAH